MQGNSGKLQAEANQPLDYAAFVVFEGTEPHGNVLAGGSSVAFSDFLGKQFIDVIEWNEPADGILSYRYPMRDLEIQNGGQLTVTESQMAAFVNEGKIADVLGPGLHTLNTRNLPILTDLMNWDKAFESPFKSEVYFFSTRLQMDQKWGTATPITIRDNEFGAVRLRCFGIYSYRLVDPRLFFTRVSGTRSTYFVQDLEGMLRNVILAHIADGFANSNVPFLDMAANQAQLAAKISEELTPDFAGLGLELDQFVVENVSLPEELAKVLDQRIGMRMVGDMGKYTQYAAAESLDLAASNTGGGAGVGMGLGAGAAVAQVLASSLRTPVVGTMIPAPTPVATVEGTKYCMECGHAIPSKAKFCSECGQRQ